MKRQDRDVKCHYQISAIENQKLIDSHFESQDFDVDVDHDPLLMGDVVVVEASSRPLPLCSMMMMVALNRRAT